MKRLFEHFEQSFSLFETYTHADKRGLSTEFSSPFQLLIMGNQNIWATSEFELIRPTLDKKSRLFRSRNTTSSGQYVSSNPDSMAAFRVV
ncbi:unnamed protein product [Parascedosporium putredinis]|uniref:Uncharacterized protein n=1 Tax=Parascedosporium putredinis TaxID=1442378 RepID=A0A9P1H488_9PEZI|nr:unnamed protein product [Parascedosporium putredinis]CAI7996403.1 unnamed protein product [Parascedosporium putredinis]